MATPRSSAYTNILGEQVSKRFVYLGVAGLVVFLAALLGGGYYLMAKNRVAGPLTREAVTSREVPTPRESFETESVAVAVPATPGGANEPTSQPAVITSLSLLLDLHIKATGFDEVNCFILNGTVAASGTIWDLTLMAREPNLYKLKTMPTDAALSIEYGYDSERAWAGGTQPQLTEAQFEFYMSMMVVESSMTHLAWSYRSAAELEGGLDAVLELRPAEVWNGHNCAVVVSRGILPFPITHYIDTTTYEEVYRRAMVRGEAGEAVEIELYFIAADGSTPHRLPMGYELYVDGELHDTVTFSKRRVIRVIPSSLFDAPSGSEYQSSLK